MLASLQVLCPRQHDQIADGDVPRTGQHEDNRLSDVLRPEALSRSRAAVDLCRLVNSPEFIEHQSGRHGPYPDAALQKLATQSMHERLNRVFGSTVNRFPMNGLMA